MSASTGAVSSSGRMACGVSQAWEKVCFYEHIAIRPSWLLRMVLPVPLRTTGAYRKAGDSSRCRYSDGGFLTKRITRIAAGESLDFEITEQSIRYSGWIRLKGGTIQVLAHDDGTSCVRMITRYEVPASVFSITRFFIEWIIMKMHGIVIRDMQHRLAELPRHVAGDVPMEQ